MIHLQSTSSFNDIKGSVQTLNPETLTGSFNIVLNQVQSMAVKALQALPSIVLALFIFILFLILAKCIKEFIKHFSVKRTYAHVGLVLARLTQWAFIIMGFLIFLAIIFPSITVANLLGGVGVMSVIAGLAFKDILHNYLSGILILLKRPFKVGDELHFIYSNKDYYGKVEHIDTRYTFLKSFDGRRILIPNGEIYTNVVVVNTTYAARRSEIQVTIGPYDILNQANSAMLDGIKSIEGVLENPEPDILLVDLVPNAVVVRLRWWTEPQRNTVLRVKSEVYSLIQAKLIETEVDIPYPTQNIFLKDQSE